MITATIFEAKTHLSELVKKAQKGETVVITTERAKTPVARIEAIKPSRPKRLGILKTPGFKLTKAFWEPLPEEELKLWEGKVSEDSARHPRSPLGGARSRIPQP
jgi:prevent-host-death family protein